MASEVPRYHRPPKSGRLGKWVRLCWPRPVPPAPQELPTTEWFAWRQKVLDFVSADEEDARIIHWVYTLEGDVGKSWLNDYMVKTYEALVVAVDKPTDVKHIILTAMKGAKITTSLRRTRSLSRTSPAPSRASWTAPRSTLLRSHCLTLPDAA